MSVVDADFVRARTTEAELSDGTRVRLRPLTSEDGPLLVQGFERLSPESRYRRFMSPIDELTPEMLRELTDLDYRDHFAWAAVALDEPGEPGVGVSRYLRVEGEPEVAEAAVTVIDDYQGRGLGTLLLQALGAAAIANGVRRFRGYVLEDNRAIRDLLGEAGASMHHEGPGVMQVEVELPAEDEDLRQSPAYRALAALARGEPPKLLRWGALWHPTP